MPDTEEPEEKSAEERLLSLEPPKAPPVPPPPELRADLPKREAPETNRVIGSYRGMGVAYMVPASLVVPIVLFTLLGNWMDGKMATREPVWTLGGALLGSVVGIINMVRAARSLGR